MAPVQSYSTMTSSPATPVASSSAVKLGVTIGAALGVVVYTIAAVTGAPAASLALSVQQGQAVHRAPASLTTHTRRVAAHSMSAEPPRAAYAAHNDVQFEAPLQLLPQQPRNLVCSKFPKHRVLVHRTVGSLRTEPVVCGRVV